MTQSIVENVELPYQVNANTEILTTHSHVHKTYLNLLRNTQLFLQQRKLLLLYLFRIETVTEIYAGLLSTQKRALRVLIIKRNLCQ